MHFYSWARNADIYTLNQISPPLSTAAPTPWPRGSVLYCSLGLDGWCRPASKETLSEARQRTYPFLTCFLSIVDWSSECTWPCWLRSIQERSWPFKKEASLDGVEKSWPQTTSDADKKIKNYQGSNAVPCSAAICCSFHLSTS